MWKHDTAKLKKYPVQYLELGNSWFLFAGEFFTVTQRNKFNAGLSFSFVSQTFFRRIEPNIVKAMLKHKLLNVTCLHVHDLLDTVNMV